MEHVEWVTAFWDLDRLGRSVARPQAAWRGQQFEDVLWKMLEESGLDPRTGYRPSGEQIDGSFVLDGRTFLLEAKWTSDPVSASSLYQFRGKVEGKLVGTVGVFISMSGYSRDAVDALLAGKTLNLILISGDEIRAVASRELDFPSVMRRKLRAAAEEGTPFTPTTGADFRAQTDPRPLTVVVVEGFSDLQFLSRLLDSTKDRAIRDIRIVAAQGRDNLVYVANNNRSIDELVYSVIVVDGDGRPEAVRRHLERVSDDLDSSSIFVLDPSMHEILDPRPYSTGDAPSRSSSADSDNVTGLWGRALENAEFRRLLYQLGLIDEDD